MKVYFNGKNNDRNLPVDIADLIGDAKVFECVRRDALYAAVKEWFVGNDVDYEVHLTDEHYPVDDGIEIKGNILRVWVAGSSIIVKKTDVESVFQIEAEGKRTSFDTNPTGAIGKYFWGFGHDGYVQDVRIETQARAPWDELGNPFVPTLLTRVKHSQEIGELAIIASYDCEIKAALEIIVRRLRDPDPVVCEAVRFATYENWNRSFFARASSADSDVRNIMGW